MQAWVPGSSEERSRIEAEAARLLARLHCEPSPEEEAEICAWIESDPRHAVAFAQAELAWDSAERLKSAAAEIRLPPAELMMTEAQQARLSRNIMVAAAAAVLLFIVAAIVTIHTFSGVDRYETAVGEIRDIALADGSGLHLNSGSEAEVRFTDNGRRVRILQGEASFKVAHEADRAFEVEARSAVIRATGTAFNVRMRDQLIELTVTEGSVSVQAGDHLLRKVSAGQGAIIRPQTIELTRLDPGLVSQRTAWREQMVELNGETIEQATQEFNRYRTAPILIGDTRVSGLRIGGRFRISDSGEFLSALQASLPVRAVNGEDGSVMLLYRDEPLVRPL